MPRDQGRRPGRGSYAYDKAHPFETVMETLCQHEFKMGSMREEVKHDRPAPRPDCPRGLRYTTNSPPQKPGRHIGA